MDNTSLVELLNDARRFELSAFSDLDDAQLLGERAHHVEPPIWEMGHVAWFQEYWILRHLDGNDPLLERADGMYDALNVSYKLRWSHDFPSKEETLAYARDVLERCAARLSNGGPTPEDEYFYRLAALHEGMHTENLLGVRQALGYPRPALPDAQPEDVAEPGYQPHDVEIAGGEYLLGALRDYPFVFDNEKWAHPVTVAPFRIAVTAVTNAEYARFVDAGGYADRRLWDKRGWDWRRRQAIAGPLTWVKRDGTWHERLFDELAPLRLSHPVCHLNWHEAHAYCRFAKRRLPTEAEWEVAASFDPATGTKRLYPWGESPPRPQVANLDLARAGTVDVRALAEGDAASGCRQMIGNVWEWTESIFEPYPGFEVDPYAEYSVPYFGQKPVLRGGCFATRAPLIRNTYRNFFIRHRRTMFAGLRTCAL